MLSERLVTAALGVLNRRYLATDPAGPECFPAPRTANGYVLYAHVPFCERLCTYCSFNRFLYKEDRARDYFRSLRAEMRLVRDIGYDFSSLYIGGGTPTILLDELVETIDLAHELFPSIGEVSAETSPNHLGDELVEALTGRVQRLSVGVQSFDDRLLRQMDRYGKYGSGDEVFERLASVARKFPSFNVDMIFNFPSQSEDVLERDIALVKNTGASQTTFYPLMASPLRRRELAQTVGDIDFAREARYYGLISRALAPEFEPASAWTFSRNRETMIDEYIVDFPEYVGVGSGALSFLGGRMYGNTFSLGEYGSRIESGSLATVKRGRPYSRKALMRYRFVTDLFGLRLDKERFRRDFRMPIELALPLEMAFMSAAGGIATNTSAELTLTEIGRYLLLVIMRETLATSNDARDRARAELPLEERVLLLEGDTSAFVEAAAPLAAG
ncbi:MAG: coproporphyrinogen III oxidase family protein [Coriobacteriales bacterium]|nr:coproporphyrinogen III oxidase family protein [Coriobacteriales bacterium]